MTMITFQHFFFCAVILQVAIVLIIVIIDEVDALQVILPTVTINESMSSRIRTPMTSRLYSITTDIGSSPINDDHRSRSSTHDAMITAAATNSAAYDDEDKILCSLYPPKSILFDETNAIVKSFLFSEESNNMKDQQKSTQRTLSWFINEMLPSLTNSRENKLRSNNYSRFDNTDYSSFLSGATRRLTSRIKWIKNDVNNIDDNYNQKDEVDISIEFENANKGAKELVLSCLKQTSSLCECCDHNDTAQIQLIQSSSNNENDEELNHVIEYFTVIFKYFQDVFNQEHSGNKSKNVNNLRYRARIVSSIGQRGVKCPRWHVDHVPVRLIMSLKGPGCMYVPYEIEMKYKSRNSYKDDDILYQVNRTALNGIDMDDSEIANSIIMPNNSELVLAKMGKEMEGVLLMGRCWEKNVSSQGDDQSRSSTILASPHRSPNLDANDMRILLTVDVLPAVDSY